MAAAYAALVSLTNLVHTIRHHPNPPITLQNHQVHSLLQVVSVLQQFLELHYHEDAYPTDGPESRIRDAAPAAEDAVESYIVDQIGGSTSDVEGRRNSFNQDLQNAIEDLDTTAKQAMQIEEMMEIDKARQHLVSSMLDVPPSLGQNSMVVGFDDVRNDILDKLTRQENKRKIIPIVGMGGCGKTTLAHNVYEYAPIVRHFDIRIWITISQNFIAREILLKILHQKNQESKNNFSQSQMTEREMGEEIHRSFFDRRYLIVLDDIWSTEAWDEIRHYFPDNNNGSRIIITTRISSVAIQLSDSSGCQINLLSKEESWELFCKHVFGEDACPLDLEEVGKAIVGNCKGLPLSIVVIGGLLATSERTKQHWKYVAKNLNSIVNLEDDKHCLRIMHMSYKQLPVHLKSYFLYLGVYPDDATISVSNLVRRLVAEGFLKPIDKKSIEVIAREYIKDLIDRNLILVHTRGSMGNIKYCKIHDLLRDVCIREAQKERFLYVMGEHNCGKNEARRIVFQRRTSISMEKHPSQNLDGFLPAPLTRSLICRDECAITNLKLLRIWIDGTYVSEEKDKNLKVGEVYNLRYFDRQCLTHKWFDIIHHSINLLWNLQTLIFDYATVGVAPIEIWKMAQIRNIITKHGAFQLPDPPDDKFILQNLHILGCVSTFKWNEKVVERIPNIKKLRIRYDDAGQTLDRSSNRSSNCCLNLCRKRKNDSLNINFEHLHKLESLYYSHSRRPYSFSIGPRRYLKQIITFPCSLKKLYLESFNLFWEDITTQIGLLPNLEKLTLRLIKGREWIPDEGHFRCLKYLKVSNCNEFETWIVDDKHFLLLERLVFEELYKLQEIPSIVGEIPTLKSIELSGCSESAILSTKKITEEQEELGNSSLLVKVSIHLSKISMSEEEVLSLSRDNFQIKVRGCRRQPSMKGGDQISVNFEEEVQITP